ncbi:hypothetical protein CRG98_046556 [Punica granatum]|uniref:Plastocyanin-like domain-containing protein n=1 Tax=Punica granatum TaxID=22663 RepID=A0A2I0HMU5_PUNGR|nr:hypothetical protein CRG98_046556 [Punica granatum]
MELDLPQARTTLVSQTLQAYYDHISWPFSYHLPMFPPYVFNFTAEYLPLVLETPKKATEVIVLDYASTVDIVMQSMNVVAGIDHPIRLHGYSFFIVRWGFGNFDPETYHLEYNLVDPPRRNTVTIPKNRWATIRFKAENPDV